MFSSRFIKHAMQNKSAWRAGLAVVVVGTTFKVAYFNLSRGIMVDHMDRKHQQATDHLKCAREFGSKMAKERETSAPSLTLEQRAQLQEYLKLMKGTQPDVYPKESGRWS